MRLFRRCAPPLLAFLACTTPAWGQTSLHGKWTSKSDIGALWGVEAVHMVLTRGYGGEHSDILWYEGHPLPNGGFLGGIWKWRPASATDSLNCNVYPTNCFVAGVLPTPPDNIFCTAHTVLADGRVLIAGGTEAGETGITQSAIWDPLTNTWQSQDHMAERRWYPTNTILPDGRVLVSSGSRYIDMELFGGRSAPSGGSLLPDSLRRLGLIPGGTWEPAGREVSTNPLAWPSAREGHSSSFNNTNNEWTIFGGQDATGPKDDTWFMYRNQDFDDVENYAAIQVAHTQKPPKRWNHATLVPGNGTVLLFGGRFSGTVVLQDLWKLDVPSGPPNTNWFWRQLTPSGTPPSARHGHTALWDNDNLRMVVYGGANASDAPIDSKVYALDVSPDTAWSELSVAPDSATQSVPSIRHGHAFLLDPHEYLLQEGAPNPNYEHRAIMWGGKGVSGMCAPDTVWVLWFPVPGSGAPYRWQRVHIPGATMPSGRYHFASQLDAAGGQIIISGGDVGGTASAETWALPIYRLTTPSVQSWTALPADPKGSAVGHSMIYGQNLWARKQEIFDPTTHHWTDIETKKRQDWYPFHFVLPQTDSTRIFYAGPNDTTMLLVLKPGSPTKGYWRPFPETIPSALARFRGGSAVMFLPGQILKVGGRDTDAQDLAARGMAQRINLNNLASSPTWVATDSLGGRVNCNYVILPNGKVLAVGGTGVVDNDGNLQPQYTPQMWDPATNLWTSVGGSDALASQDAIRGYHSNAILLPDGRVLSTSGFSNYRDDVAGQDAIKANVYCPPYLFSASGGLKTRPVITPTNDVNYGVTFKICVDNFGTAPSVIQVNLLRPAASTHAWNMDQRFIPLAFQSSCNGRELYATAPANSSIAPPGDYLVFAVRGDQTPSIGKWIRLGSTATPEEPICVNGCGGGGLGAMMAGGSGSGWQEVNALATSSGDAMPLKLAATPLASDGSYALKVSQTGQAVTSLDQLQLWTVDHAASEDAFASAGHNYLGQAVPAARVESMAGEVTSQAMGEAGMMFEVEAQDTLVVTFDGKAEGTTVPGFVVARRASRDLPQAGENRTVFVETPAPGGGWRAAGQFEPRLNFAEAVFDSCVTRMRLYSEAPFQVRAAGHVEVTGADPKVSTLLLSSASEGSKTVSMTDLASADGVAASIGATEVLIARWSAPATQASTVVRTTFVRAKSSTVSLASAAIAQAENGNRATIQAFQFSLGVGRPNPAIGRTTIEYSLAHSARVRIRVYDVAGRLVRTLVDRNAAAGPDEVVWDGTNDDGRRLGSGMFFYRMEAGEWTSRKKLILLGGS